MTVETLEQAIATTKQVLANVTPDQLDTASPCASWKVRDVINHMVGGTFFFASMISGEEPQRGSEPPDFTSGDISATYADGAAKEIAAFSAPGAMEKTHKLPFGELPGSAVVVIAATDQFQHAWDLAKATGQSTDLNPDLATQLLEFATKFIPESFRGADGQAAFTQIVDVPESAPPADRLAGFLGRTP